MTSIGEAFTSFRDAWRVEARDVYRVDEEEPLLAAWHQGVDVSTLSRRDGWIDVLVDAAARNAHVSRVRLIGHPITDYTRFEWELYPSSIAAGEVIRVVDRTWLDDSWLSTPDVWLFDDRVAFRQLYDADGVYLGAELVDAVPIVELRRRLEQVAVPFAEYRLTEIPAPRPGSTTVPRLPRGVAAATE